MTHLFSVMLLALYTYGDYIADYITSLLCRNKSEVFILNEIKKKSLLRVKSLQNPDPKIKLTGPGWWETGGSSGPDEQLDVFRWTPLQNQ